MSRISESSNVSNLFSPSMINMVVGVFDFVISLMMIFKINLYLSLVVVIMLPFYVVLSVYFSSRIKKSVTQMNEDSAIMAGGVFETINSIEEIKILDLKTIQMNKVEKLSKIVKESIVNMNRNLNFYFENFSFMSAFIGTGILYLSGLLIIDHAFTIGSYIAFTGYLSRILGNLQVYSTAGITIQPILVSIRRIQEFLGYGDEGDERDRNLIGGIEKIEFINVSFNYADKREVIRNFNQTIIKGETILILGSNGSGKSTLIKLLLGLYNPSDGQIMLNDVDLTKIKLNDLREKIGVVSQNIHLFKGTILDNILLGSDDSKLSYLNKLIKDYNLDVFLNFENKLDTEIGNGGSNLSGGQKQLIGFLRALVLQKEILILDEPTSALDTAVKECVIDIIKNRSIANITIIISHDPSFYFIDNKIYMNKNFEGMVAK
ncbi:ABC transporter ATP-binding protein [Paenibacillus sp. JNUCC31]|nr:ABC transporter ATP-binding protein [Paenibacillus sp. JNUCC-31]